MINNETQAPEVEGFSALALRIIEQLPANLRPRARGFFVNILDTFQPESVVLRPLPNEEILLEIHMAWYRDILGIIVLPRVRLLTGIAILATIIMIMLSLFLALFALSLALIPAGILFVLVSSALVERFSYKQYRLLQTNARTVISIPQKNAWPLVDNIELHAVPKIIDTNWSPNTLWRIFQFFTGARDLYISMSGLQFVEGKAMVRDALIIPDVAADQVFELKKLVFKAG